jgi:hypothetical protein
MSDWVGPVLQVNPVGQAVADAIQEQNPGARVTHRDSYLRVEAPRRCEVTRQAIEARTGAPFHFPGDLEEVMSAFKGRIAFEEGKVVWWAPASAKEPVDGT